MHGLPVKHVSRASLPGSTGIRVAWGVLGALVAIKLLLHLLTSGNYGYFRDELYYLACGRRLSWGYVDHPPLVPLLARFIEATVGAALPLLRLGPALATTVVVGLTGLMARQMGGGRYAQFLAALAALLSPAFLVMGTFLSVNAFDILWWTICQYLLVAMLNGRSQRLWLAIGAVMGVGLLTKYNIAFFGLGVFAALVITRERTWLRRPWPWLGAALAFIIFLPNLLWQWEHGWPTLEFLRNIRLYKNYPVNPIEFVIMQIVVVHPVIFPVWLFGLLYCLRGGDGRRYRMLGWAYLVVFAVFMLMQAKFYYLFPIYPMLLAAGGVKLERLFARMHSRWIRPAFTGMLILGCAAMAPYTVPILPLDRFLAYNQFLSIQDDLRFEKGRVPSKPIIYADMIGWKRLAEAVAGTFRDLPPEERSECTILTSNYGEAGAVDFFLRNEGVPSAICRHNSYHFWGPGKGPWPTVIAVGFDRLTLDSLFDRVALVGEVFNPVARESHVRIHRCESLKQPLDEVWPKLKVYR